MSGQTDQEKKTAREKVTVLTEGACLPAQPHTGKPKRRRPGQEPLRPKAKTDSENATSGFVSYALPGSLCCPLPFYRPFQYLLMPS